jgi:hypothetical protein
MRTYTYFQGFAKAHGDDFTSGDPVGGWGVRGGCCRGEGDINTQAAEY